MRLPVGQRGRREFDDPAENPDSDDDDDSFRDREAARLVDARQREEDRDTAEEARRESGA